MAAYSKTDPLGSSKLVTRTSRPTKTQELQLFTRTRTGHRKKSTSPAIHSKPVDSARPTQIFANQTRSPKPIPVGTSQDPHLLGASPRTNRTPPPDAEAPPPCRRLPTSQTASRRRPCRGSGGRAFQLLPAGSLHSYVNRSPDRAPR